MRILLWTVPVTDQERARALYTGALGLRVREDAPWGEGMRWLEVGGSDGEPGLVLATWFPPLPGGFALGAEYGRRARGRDAAPGGGCAGRGRRLRRAGRQLSQGARPGRQRLVPAPERGGRRMRTRYSHHHPSNGVTGSARLCRVARYNASIRLAASSATSRPSR